MPQADRHQPAALSRAEREAILAVLGEPAGQDLSVVQAYWRALDAGQVACSQRTFYRVAAAAGLAGDRRRARPRAHRPPPRAAAAAPGELWSWDITELRGPRGQRYKLYLVLDVFSRYPVAWRIEHREDARAATAMLAAAIDEHGAPKVLHADNGGPMRSGVLAGALAGLVALSYSRPRTSDDNPFSESMFKTLKYDLSCPERFDGIEHARSWTRGFLDRYATEHRHSGLGWHTPADAYHGTAAAVRARRQEILDAYHAAHPERFRRPPVAPPLPGPTGINTRKHPTLSQTG